MWSRSLRRVQNGTSFSFPNLRGVSPFILKEPGQSSTPYLITDASLNDCDLYIKGQDGTPYSLTYQFDALGNDYKYCFPPGICQTTSSPPCDFKEFDAVCEKGPPTKPLPDIAAQMHYSPTADKCPGLTAPTNTRLPLLHFRSASHQQQTDHFLSCVIPAQMENYKHVMHTYTSQEIPHGLSGIKMSLHYSCVGNNLPDCQVSVLQKESKDGMFKSSTLWSRSNQSVITAASQIGEWAHVTFPVPEQTVDFRVKLQASVTSNGRVGLDNVYLHTDKKCTPRWIRIPKYRFKDLQRWKEWFPVKESLYRGLGEAVHAADVNPFQARLEQCARYNLILYMFFRIILSRILAY